MNENHNMNNLNSFNQNYQQQNNNFNSNININSYDQQIEQPLIEVKNKQNKKLFLIIGSIALVLIVVGSIIGFNIYMNKEEENKINSDILISNQLYNDYENGIITTDEYVRYSLYAEYDSSLLNKKYSKFNGSQVAIHTDELIDLYYDELSDETLKYYISKINLENVTFEIGKENKSSDNKVAIADLFVDTVYAKSENVTNLNKAILSKNGNFIVWYTTTGDSATNYESAKKIADGLEQTISEYDNLFGSNYNFKSKVLTKGKTYNNQIKILNNENIDSQYLESAMQVYLVNYNDDSLAKYVRGSQALSELWDKIVGGDDYGSLVLPYILIKPSAFNDFENIEQLYNHEFFHHYQHNVLCGTNNCVMGSDPYIGEATANWASALATNKTNDTGFLNQWAGTARKYSSAYMSDDFINKYGTDIVGYTLYVYMYNYSSIVSNGTDKILKSIYEDNALKYLQDNATKEELANIQSTIAYKNLAQDYSNKNLIVEVAFNTPIQVKETITAEKSFNDIRVSPLTIDYYLLDVNSKEQQYEIKLIRDNANINATLIGELNGEYQMLESSSVEKDSFVFNTNYYGDYDKLYIAISNILPTLKNYYSLEISKTSFLDAESLLENYELDESLIINGFKFNLGIKLEDFINGTGAIIDEEDLEIAKSKSESFSGLSNEIATKIIAGGQEINFEIYVNTSDLNNIKVNGLSIKSDRGGVDVYPPDTLGRPNLVACEFKVLGKYNIDTSTFDDLDRILKIQATNKDDEYSNQYELKVKGKEGFGITIRYDTYKKDLSKYYIRYVNITNNTGLSW